VLASLAEGESPQRPALREAVRALLADLAAAAPGRSVEVRVPPFGAIQCVEGPRHTRGTPSNVVEMDPVTFVELAAGRLSWAGALKDGRIRASGVRADISYLFPII
jgi:Bacterial SCP ortholog